MQNVALLIFSLTPRLFLHTLWHVFHLFADFAPYLFRSEIISCRCRGRHQKLHPAMHLIYEYMSNLDMHSTQKDADSRKSKHCAQPTVRASFSFVFTDCLLLLHLSLLQATSSRGRLFGPFLVTLELRLPAPLLLQLNLTPRTAYLSSSARGCSWRSKSRGPSSGAAFFVLWALGKCTMRMTSFCTLSAQCKSFKLKAWGNDPFWEVLRKHAG